MEQNTYVYGAGALVSTTNNAGDQRYTFPDGLGSADLTIGASDNQAISNYSYDVFGSPRNAVSASPGRGGNDLDLSSGSASVGDRMH